MSIIGNAVTLGGGGFYPSLTVTTDSGATVTATLGGKTVVLSEIESGTYWGELTDYGTWTVTATKDGDTSSDVVQVEAVENYELNLAFIHNVNDATWEEISAISQAGTAANYWSIGDTKAITLNGTVGTKSYSNVTLYLFILHFNMPVNKSTADNNIIWGGFKTALTSGVDVGLNDSAYNTNPTSGTIAFNMNHWWNTSTYGSNYGGWKGCDLRYDILGATGTQASDYGSIKSTSNVGYDATTAAITSPKSNTLMAALPSDFRSVLRLWTRWVDNVGNSSNVDANVTACVDAGISLLTEFEIHGIRSYANQYEQNHQVQMMYYANGNSKIKYRQSSSGIAAVWWVASPCYNSYGIFCSVSTTGSAYYSIAYYSYAVAPAFKT